MGKHSGGPQETDSDRVIRVLARMVDSHRAEQIAGWIRSEEEAEADVQEIIDDAWREVTGYE